MRGEAVTHRRVLVTRPEPAASLTALRLAELGFEPVLLPLSRTVRLAFSMPETEIDALVVTSANVFRHVDQDVLQSLLTMPLVAVGEGTALAARKAGFEGVTEGGGDAVRLAETMRRTLPDDAQVLYLAGRVRQPIFEEHVTAAGIAMTVRDVYDIEAIDYTRDALAQILGRVPVAAVMLYSGVAAEQFVVATTKIEQAFGVARFLCISARVAAKLPAEWQKRALVADQPDERGLFRLFAKL